MRASVLTSELAPGGREGLLDALASLDRLLEQALDLARTVYGWEPASARFRGLFISASDAENILGRTPAESPFAGLNNDLFLRLEFPGLERLAERHGLDTFDRAILILAAAPELDTRYERLYAFLQDDVSRRRPSVDLLLNLLCGSALEKLDRRVHFSADSPLIRKRLIHLHSEPNQIKCSLISQWVMLDEQVVRQLLGTGGLDSRLAGCSQRITRELSLSSLPLEPDQAEGIRTFAVLQRSDGEPLRLHFAGPSMPLKRLVADALASELGRPLLAVDLARASEPAEVLGVAVSEAEFSNALLYLDAHSASEDVEMTLLRGLDNALHDGETDVIVASHRLPQLDAPALLSVEFRLASFGTRRKLWQMECQSSGIELTPVQLDSMAGLFRLYPDQIGWAVSEARNRARWRGDRTPNVDDLAASARSRSSRQIDSLATKIQPSYMWDDLILPQATVSQLRALCSRVIYRHQVLEGWGFDRKLSMGKGATALFAGPSGTGKTMASEIIARELGLELYKIDLSGIVSKYIGETEKNLERIFRAAENANAILFFDEADALFGKRSEVRDSHDRYANIEVSYLLQKMEMYDGVAILASNLRQNLDDSFIRRLAFTVHFPFPDAEHRRRIWDGIWPIEAPRDPALDLDFLASKFKLSGGNIKNVALASAFLAAEEATAISMRHVLTAVDREFQKMGKPLSDDQLRHVPSEVEP